MRGKKLNVRLQKSVCVHLLYTTCVWLIVRSAALIFNRSFLNLSLDLTLKTKSAEFYFYFLFTGIEARYYIYESSTKKQDCGKSFMAPERALKPAWKKPQQIKRSKVYWCRLKTKQVFLSLVFLHCRDFISMRFALPTQGTTQYLNNEIFGSSPAYFSISSLYLF